jgi:MFS family permease
VDKDAPFEIIQSTGAWAIILLQLIVNRLTKNIPTARAIVLGFALSTVSWLIVAIHPNLWTIVACIFSFAIGEMTQAPRYYEYISDIAPKGQQGLFQGYAFLPIAIAWGVGGTLGGWMYTNYAKIPGDPTTIWYILFGVGVAATLLMALYNSLFASHEPQKA